METEDIPEYDVRSERVGRVRILFRDALGRARSSLLTPRGWACSGSDFATKTVLTPPW